MKYSGYIKICDEKGQEVFTRSFSDDEVVETLLKRIEESETVTISSDRKIVPITIFKETVRPSKVIHTCCGSKHKAHRITCEKYVKSSVKTPEVKKTDSDDESEEDEQEEEPTPPGTLTIGQFNRLKTLKELGRNSVDISADLQVTLKTVNAAWSAPSYQYYLEHK